MTIGNPYDTIPTSSLGLSGLETVGELDIKLALQGAELEQGLAERIAGIGSPRAMGVSREVDRYRRARHILGRRDLNARQQYAELMGLAAEIDQEHLAGIGFLKKLRKKVGTAVARAGRAVRQSNLLKRVATGVKAAGRGLAKGAKATGKFAVKAGKAFVKVVSYPARMFVKGLAEVLLPRMSQFFLYLFITNPATIAALPAKVQAKRRKAERFAKFMTNTIGMKEAHFMKIVRNGILKNTRQTPEQLLARHVKGSLSGVGVLPVLAVPLAIKLAPTILGVIQKLIGLFGKKPSAAETPTAADTPDEATDFGDAPTPVRRAVLTHLAHKPASQQGYEAAPPAEEAREQRQEATALEQVYAEPASTPLEAPLPAPVPARSYDPGVTAQPAYDGQPDGGPAYEPEAGYDPNATPPPADEPAGEAPQF